MKNSKVKMTQTKDLITLSVPARVRSERQQIQLNRWLKSGDYQSAITYLSSLGGQKTRGLFVDRMTSGGRDDLERKAPGQVLRQFEAIFDLDEAHVPRGKDTDWIGVEIECCIPKESIPPRYVESSEPEEVECGYCDGTGVVTDSEGDEGECDVCCGSGQVSNPDYDEDSSEETQYHNGLKVLFSKEKIKFANVKHDGSIDAEDSDYFAVEITVLTRLNRPENLERACKLLNRLGAKVNKSCGMHVHLDARHLTSGEAVVVGSRFRMALPVMLAMVPKTRRDNNYCRPVVSTLRGDRYSAVNLTAYEKFESIEVRLHSSTTDFKKILNWSRFIHAIATSSALDDASHQLESINDLTEYVSIDESLVEYISQRTALFSPDSTDTKPVAEEFTDTDSTDLELEIGA